MKKFKRLVAECKKAALIMKRASGIKRFQEDKSYGKWFNCLLPLVQTRASCQSEQAIESSRYESHWKFLWLRPPFCFMLNVNISEDIAFTMVEKTSLAFS